MKAKLNSLVELNDGRRGVIVRVHKSKKQNFDVEMLNGEVLIVNILDLRVLTRISEIGNK